MILKCVANCFDPLIWVRGPVEFLFILSLTAYLLNCPGSYIPIVGHVKEIFIGGKISMMTTEEERQERATIEKHIWMVSM